MSHSEAVINKYGPNIPMQLLALFSSDSMTITEMRNETVIFSTEIVYAEFVINVTVVSPSNFVNIAQIVVLTFTEIFVYTVSLYDDFSVSMCNSGHQEIESIDAIYDARSNKTWIAGLQNGQSVFIPIDQATECPDLAATQTWQFSSPDGSVDISQIFNFGFVSQIQPDHAVPRNWTGCFPALSSRTLVYFSTQTLVFVFGFEANASSTSVAFTRNASTLVSDASLISSTSVITAVAIFGECFGNFHAPSQSLWLAIAVFDSQTQNATLNLISLNEFSLSPLSCDLADPDWWLHPASYRDNCTFVSQTCANTNYYVVDDTACENRTIGAPASLSLPSAHLLHRLQTGSYNSEDSFMDYAHLLFSWATSDIVITVNAFQEIACSATSQDAAFILQQLNVIGVGRHIEATHISENGQHVFITYPKEQWEIDSHTRFLEICSILSAPSTSLASPSLLSASPTATSFLAPYNDTCNSLAPIPMTTYDYMLYYSSCTGGSSCWRYGDFKNEMAGNLNSTYVGYPIASEYSSRPTNQFDCDPGFFCPGFGMRFECAVGHICPEPGMQSPTTCDLNPNYDTTCVYNRLIQPVACPDGMVCITPASSPIPAPPGYYVTLANREVLYPCDQGEWCALQRQNVSGGNATDLLCLGGTFCATPDVITPTVCSVENSTVDFCPNGTVTPSLCPAGYYCPTPTQQSPCFEDSYCPAGSQQSELCPRGNYCPTPDVIYVCPEGHYCREGFTYPEKCHPFVICPEGTASEKFAVSGIIFDIAIVVVLIAAYYLGIKIRDRIRLKRETARIASPDFQERRKPNITLKPKTQTIKFTFDNMGLALHGSKRKVLDGVTGSIRPGRVTAVMGPSGAGKTTFLTTLAGKATYGERTGTVCINGVPADIDKFKKVVGFVPQEDIMHRELTVKEIIRMNAELRLPASFTRKEIALMTNEVLSVLGLWDIRHQIIGDETTRGISGGQRKRVNIGMELVADPTVIFLDEPTSGLDSTSSEEVVTCLRKVADLGLTIVTVLHQPRYEIFQLFHDVLLLGKGGKTVYIGASSEALGYFQALGFTCPEHTNPPDFFMDIISGNISRAGHPEFTPKDLYTLWEDRKPMSPQMMMEANASSSIIRIDDTGAGGGGGSTTETDFSEMSPLVGRKNAINSKRSKKSKNAKLEGDINRKTAGFFKQLFLFTVRALVQQSRDVKGFFWDNVLIVIAGTLLGALYIDIPYKGPIPAELQALCPSFLENSCKMPQTDKLSAMAGLVSLSIGFTAMAASMRCFGTEKVIFWRECSSGINKVAYFLGKNIAQLVNISLAPVVFLSVFYTLTSPRATVSQYYVTLLMLQFSMVGIGYLISIALPYKNAQLTGVVIALVCAMFGGSNPSLKQLKQSLLTHAVASISPYRWSQEALYISEIRRYASIYDINSSLAFWGFDINNFSNDLLVLLGIGAGARVLALAALLLLNRDKMK